MNPDCVVCECSIGKGRRCHTASGCRAQLRVTDSSSFRDASATSKHGRVIIPRVAIGPFNVAKMLVKTQPSLFGMKGERKKKRPIGNDSSTKIWVKKNDKK